MERKIEEFMEQTRRELKEMGEIISTILTNQRMCFSTYVVDLNWKAQTLEKAVRTGDKEKLKELVKMMETEESKWKNIEWRPAENDDIITLRLKNQNGSTDQH